MNLMKHFVLILVLVFSFTLSCSLASFGQEPKPVASPNTPPPGPAQKSEQEKEIEKKEQSQRILGVVPQFGVTSRHDAPPLTPGGKFHLFTKAAFDPVEFGLVGLQAGISQAENEFPSYGPGAEGYAKRYGAAFADEVSSGFWSNFFYATLLMEDPRYFRSGSGTIKRRIGYAVEQEFVCHTDKGGRSFNFSNVLGAFTSGAISNVYYPQSDRGASLTLSRSAIALMYGSLGGLVDEFWPDISRALFKKHKKDGPNP
ncbi:MAG: hypothetical protein JWO91_741 [Acidobacteriaceae bacterium]|jgi:hypothetical protein|nr:hypothetical protein [Acidobacteriaceae bacterium]